MIVGGMALDPGNSNCGETLAGGVRVVLQTPDGDVHEGVVTIHGGDVATWLVVLGKSRRQRASEAGR